MKIAYILYPEVVISNRSNGVRRQAIIWAELLRGRGHIVDYIDNWDDYDWKVYDIIHLFGGGKWIYDVVRRLSVINSNIVWSPIVDPRLGKYVYLKHTLCRHLNHFTRNRFLWVGSDMFNSVPFCKGIFTRSNFEGDFICRVYKVPKEKIFKVPLTYSAACQDFETCEKEPFCLHISSIYQERKNVLRLINAAKKYQFDLVLAGNRGPETQFKPLQDAIGNSSNIKILGFISEDDKINLYKRAKVFALPSINEGVGIVALDAAFFGCEILITNIPGPKEYYGGKACEVDPYDEDEIGCGVMSLLNGSIGFQPELSSFIKDTYSRDSICNLLIKSYIEILS